MTPEREAELLDLIYRLAWRILLAHEVIGRWADKDKPGRKKAVEPSHPCG